MYTFMLFPIIEINYSSSGNINFQKRRQATACLLFGGDKRDRTADLLNAIQALSQLSYTPGFSLATVF
jgi:hypothetical protein